MLLGILGVCIYTPPTASNTRVAVSAYWQVYFALVSFLSQWNSGARVKGLARVRDLPHRPPAALRSDLLDGGEVEFPW